jgi:hypothetical protein
MEPRREGSAETASRCFEARRVMRMGMSITNCTRLYISMNKTPLNWVRFGKRTQFIFSCISGATPLLIASYTEKISQKNWVRLVELHICSPLPAE